MSYSYDLAGHLTSVGDTSAAIVAAAPFSGLPVQFAATYTYDATNRPTGVSWSPVPLAAAPTASSVTFGHTYNAANQRIGQSVSDNSWVNYPAATASTVSYTANALNQYTAVGAVSPTYDGNGNLTFDGTFTFGYDAENRLTSASGAGKTASYTFDAQGRRKTKTVNGSTTVFITDADNREVLEYDGSSGLLGNWYSYGLGPNEVLSEQNLFPNNSTRTTQIPDIQGSIIAAQTPNGNGLIRIGYLPYGKSATAGTTGFAPFGFTGQRIDVEMGGLYYYRARQYSPVWGRFLQADPIGYGGGINLYRYVRNDPLNLIDPSGLVLDQIGSAVSGFVQCSSPCLANEGEGGLQALANASQLAHDNPNVQLLVIVLATEVAGGGPENPLADAAAAAEIAAAKGGPIAGNGASLENLTAGEITRIQNAANRTGTEISVVGSRATGSPTNPLSDWDYVVPEGTSGSTIHSLKSSLPEGVRGLGEARNLEIDAQPLLPNKPYIKFSPQ